MTAPTPTTAAAVSAVANALKAVTVLGTDERFDDRPVVRLDDGSEYWDLGGIYSDDEEALARLVLESAAPVLLADLREQIARELLRAAEALPYGELRGYAEWYAAIARGSQPPAERSES